MWKAFQRYRKLHPEARKLFRRAVVLLPRTAISLRLRGFKRTKEALQRNLSGAAPRKRSLDQSNGYRAEALQRTCRMVRAAAHYGPVRPTCLVESLALWYLLEEQGIPANLRIGVRKISERFEAHAWVENAGVALSQSDEQHHHYAAFDSAFSDIPREKP